MRSLTILLLLLFITSPLISQYTESEKVTLTGYIKDANNGETLIGAAAFVSEIAAGATSNEYGFYAIDVPIGEYTVEYSYLGFETQVKKIVLDQNMSLDIELTTASAKIEEVVITAEPEDENVSKR